MKTSPTVTQVVAALVVSLFGGVVAKFWDLPPRVTALEQKFESIDKKLDILIGSLH